MILFWLICALFVVIALAFILPPLLQTEPGSDELDLGQANIAVYRDQIEELKADLNNGLVSDEQYQVDRNEIEARLLDDVSITTPSKRPNVKTKPVPDRRLTYSLVLGMPLVAVLLYLQIGNRGAINGVAVATPPAAARAETTEQSGEQQRVAGNVEALAKRLAENPNDADGWAMLGKSYTMLEKYADAGSAYEKATALKPDDPNLLAEYAFALGMANNKSLQGKPTELLQKALTLNPDNPKALQLAGSAAFEVKNYQQAIAYWEKLLQKTQRDTELGQVLADQITEAKKLSGRE